MIPVVWLLLKTVFAAIPVKARSLTKEQTKSLCMHPGCSLRLWKCETKIFPKKPSEFVRMRTKHTNFYSESSTRNAQAYIKAMALSR